MKRKHEEEPSEKDWFTLLKETKLDTVDDIVEKELLRHSVIVLHGEITEDLCNRVSKRLMFLHFRGKKDVLIILNSVGGEIFHGLLIFNTMEDLKKKGMKITVEARGLCASMGVSLLMGGTRRVASRYTRFLLHEVTSLSYGKVSELKEGVEKLEKLNEMLDEVISQRSKLTLAVLSKKTKKREWWLSSEEALKHGIIDAIV